MIIYLILLGLTCSLILGFWIIPILYKLDVKQNVSRSINIKHLLKDKTPTMGGLIFICSSLLIVLLLYIFNKINFNYSLFLIIITFLFYAILGFLDDYLKIKYHNNKGLSIFVKLLIECIIAIIIFIIYILNNNDLSINLFSYNLDLGYLYGFVIFFYLIGFSNAVNITDGLDGLAASLCMNSYLTLGLLAIEKNCILVSLFCFVMVGSLMGFLFFNAHPARVFMGDLGSLSLGASLAICSIVLKKEMLFLLIGIVFILEFLSSFIQIVTIKYFNKRVFLKSPFHHHLEEKNFSEISIVKIFYLTSFIINCICLIID